MTGVVDPWALVLALARVAPLVLIAPALGGIPLPRVVQAALALVVALVIASGLALPGADGGVAPAAMLAGASWGERVALLGREVMIGATLGVVAAVPLLAAAAAGAWAAASSGTDDAGVDTWSWFFPITAAMVFFAVGGHLAVIGALGLSYRALPAGGGAAIAPGDALAVVVAAGAQMIAAGLALAAPLVVAALLATLLTGVVERGSAVVLAAAAALVAIAMVIAGDARALPAALAAAVDRLAPIQ
jgi:flagellar biosynthetic protein FliR